MLNARIELREGAPEVIMETYLIKDPLEQRRKRPIVVICPGGGYRELCQREAEPIALRFNAEGMHAVVVWYSVNRKFPKALEDLSAAVVKIRENADEWCVDSEKVFVCGFSAGGHLAGCLGTMWNSEASIKRDDGINRPDGMILAYPVITSSEVEHGESFDVLAGDDEELRKSLSLEKRITKDCPPVFIWHTFEDQLVSVQNSVYMVSALVEKGISTEFHLYPYGCHGLSLADESVAYSPDWIRPEVQGWIQRVADWIYSL